ncbi:MAG: NTP transferase domain-containing protein [Infirmifilum sp.]
MLPVVIVAAGVASRLRPFSLERPKSLMELEPGLTIIQFIIDRFSRAGLSPIYIVTRKEREEEFGKSVKGVRILTVDLEEFGNLYTVYTAMREVRPPFLVSMSDHIFEYEILERIISESSDKAFVICLDRKPSAAEALEGLKVRLKGGEIVEVGKGIETRYGIDTGLILVREKARRYIERVMEERGPSASIGDALSLAAKDGEVAYVDVTGLLWKDIDTAEDLITARKLYKYILVRDSERATAGPLTRIFVRPISIRLALKTPPTLQRVASLLFMLLVFTGVALYSLLERSPLGLLTVAYVLALSVDYTWILSVLSHGSVRLESLSMRLLTDFSLAFFLFYNLLLQAPLQFAYPLLTFLTFTSILPGVYDYTGGRRTLLSFVSDPLLRYSLAIILSWLGLELYAVAYWIASGLLAVLPLKPLRSRHAPREAYPRIPREKSVLEQKLEAAASSGFKLAIALIAVSLLRVYLGDILIFSEDGFILKVDDLLSASALLFVIYYGYKVLIGLKALVDVASTYFADMFGVTESVAEHLGLDALYIAATILALLIAPSSLRAIPWIGEPLARLVSVVLILLLLFLIYDFARVTYQTFEKTLRDFLERIVRAVSRVES